MRSLFWKIFLGFWLTVILAGTIMWLIATMTRPEDSQLIDRHLQFATKGLDGYARDISLELQNKGLSGWESYLERWHPGDPQPFLLTRTGPPLRQLPVPPHIRQLADEILTSGSVKALRQKREFALGEPFQLPDGRQAALIVNLAFPRPQAGEGPPRRRHKDHRIPDLDHGLGMLVFLLVATAICLLLTRSLTGPIGKLRRATQNFASGKLSTRVGDDIRGGHELAALASDFDRMAEQIESLVTGQHRLLRDISHELRSPLTRMKIALELARQRAGSEATPALDKIDQESDRLNQLIGQLLTLTRLDGQPETLEKTRLSLGELLTRVAADADFEARARQVQVACQLSTSGSLIGVPELLLRAFDNVVRNAVRYSAPGSTVTIALSQDEKELLLTVRDQGPGVPEASLKHLFEPFYRVATDRDRASGGSGIGLAITERAIQLHGGSIIATNHPHGGLQIDIRLPLDAKGSNG
jgi:two-component system sensor histidine kinase CpxA